MNSIYESIAKLKREKWYTVASGHLIWSVADIQSDI